MQKFTSELQKNAAATAVLQQVTVAAEEFEFEVSLPKAVAAGPGRALPLPGPAAASFATKAAAQGYPRRPGKPPVPPPTDFDREIAKLEKEIEQADSAALRLRDALTGILLKGMDTLTFVFQPMPNLLNYEKRSL